MNRYFVTFCLFLGGFLVISQAQALWATSAGWRSFHLDGGELREVPPPGDIQSRDGYLPFRSYSGVHPREDRLPEGTGGLAGICYIQSSGGKLRSAAAPIPLAGELLEIRGNNLTLALRADDSGFFVVALPPAAYELRWKSFTRKVTVSRGKTTLVALRGGKRMVD